jgi:hypothetical protein
MLEEPSMELIIDPDVKAVAEFMQSRMPAAKLVSVASAIAALAPILWGNYGAEAIDALRLISLPLDSAGDRHIQRDARQLIPEMASAGDGFAAAGS